MTFTSLELGHGDISIAAVKADDGKHGVMFFHTPNVQIGADTHEPVRTESDKREVFLQITSAKPESLDVLICKLQEARDYFREPNAGALPRRDSDVGSSSWGCD